MEYRRMGKSEIKLSEVALGCWVMGGDYWGGAEDKDSIDAISEAIDLGVNFIDTAELYQNYGHIKKAIELSGINPVISAKCYAYDKEGAEKSFEKARRELNRDVIDVFSLHEQESEYTLKGHKEALDYFMEQKAKGYIRAIGISTHYVKCVQAMVDMDGIDIIHPLINKKGIGICDGTPDEMLEAISRAHANGKGIYSMKALGGGNLLGCYTDALDYIFQQECIDSVAVGMQSIEEVQMNIEYFTQKKLCKEYSQTLENKALHVDYWCEGCGKCVSRCGQGALSIVDGKAHVDRNKCVLCGYCASVCKDAFALKIY